jgi:hypothetical protein
MITPRSPSLPSDCHGRSRQPADVEGADQVDVDHAAEPIEGVRPLPRDDPRGIDDSGAVHNAVQAAELLDAQPNGLVDLSSVGDVGGKKARGFAQRFARRGQGFGSQVDQEHPAAAAGEQLRAGRAQSRGGAGHQDGTRRDLHG